MLAAAVSEKGAELKVADFIKRPAKEIQTMATDNDKKGQELFKQGNYKDSIPWFERSAFFSKVLIEQAKIQEQEKLEQAKRDEQAKLEQAKRDEQARLEQAKRDEQARLEQENLRKQALQRLTAAQKELQSAQQRVKK